MSEDPTKTGQEKRIANQKEKMVAFINATSPMIRDSLTGSRRLQPDTLREAFLSVLFGDIVPVFDTRQSPEDLKKQREHLARKVRKLKNSLTGNEGLKVSNPEIYDGDFLLFTHEQHTELVGEHYLYVAAYEGEKLPDGYTSTYSHKLLISGDVAIFESPEIRYTLDFEVGWNYSSQTNIELVFNSHQVDPDDPLRIIKTEIGRYSKPEVPLKDLDREQIKIMTTAIDLAQAYF